MKNSDQHPKPEVVLSPAVKQMIRDWVEEYYAFVAAQASTSNDKKPTS